VIDHGRVERASTIDELSATATDPFVRALLGLS
jgi:hypothetical protein